MRKTLTAIALGSAVLAGGAAQAEDTWVAAFKQAVANCNAGLPKQRGYMVQRANCFNTAVETYKIGYPGGSRDADLWHVYTAYRLAVATRIDRGEISIEDADLLLAQKYSDLMTQAQARHAAQAQVNAVNRAIDNANRLNSWRMIGEGIDMMTRRPSNSVDVYIHQ